MKFENARIVKKQASQAEYRKQDHPRGVPIYRVGRSDLVEIAACPHRWLMAGAEDDTKATQWGTLVDALLLGAELGIAVTPETYEGSDGKTKPWNWNATVCRQWAESHKGHIVVKPDMLTKAQCAVKRIRDDAVIAKILAGADYQVWVEADYRHSDKLIIPVKGLIDIVPKGNRSAALADLKTTQSASLRPYGRTIWNYGYYVQAAMYLDLWNAATGEGRNTFLHVVQESDEPYEIGRRMLDNNYLQIGRGKYQAALDLYGKCLESNNWPSYDDMDAPDITRIEGWTVVSPEPWMIMNADVKMGNSMDDIG